VERLPGFTLKAAYKATFQKHFQSGKTQRLCMTLSATPKTYGGLVAVQLAMVMICGCVGTAHIPFERGRGLGLKMK